MKHIDFKEIAIDILIDISGGLLIAIAAYNFASAANFPMVGFNGIGLILYHLFGLPIGTTAFVLNIPVAAACCKLLGRGFLAAVHADHRYHVFDYGFRGPADPHI